MRILCLRSTGSRFFEITLMFKVGQFFVGRQASDLFGRHTKLRGGTQASQNRVLQGKKVSHLAQKTV